MVVGPELKEPIRSHHDIERDTVKHFKRALKVCPFSLLHVVFSSARHRAEFRSTLSSISVLSSSMMDSPSEPRPTDTPSTSTLDASTRSVCSR
jgi:hypothetical protein